MSSGVDRRSWVLALSLVAGCAQGVPSSTASATFGPPPSDQTTNAPPDSTTGPFDATTGGNGTPTDGATGTEPPPGGVDSTTSSPGSSSGVASVCGDGLVEGDEECDGEDLGGLTCPDVDPRSSSGTLACSAGCTYDTSGCGNADNPIVVCQAVNAAIPDASVTGVSDTITLPPDVVGLPITDVEVTVELTHTYIGDLTIDVSSGGSSTVLFDRCGNEEDINAVFDDQAASGLNCANSSLGQAVQPFSPLNTFNGDPLATDWTLFVVDTVGQDTGVVQQWCVTISW